MRQTSLFQRERRFPVFDPAEATRKRDVSMDRIDAKAKRLDDEAVETWRAEYYGGILNMARTLIPFLAEDVSLVVGIPEGLDGRATGPLFKRAEREGVIVPTGRFPNGKSVSRHRTRMCEWVGVGVEG